MIWIAFFVNPFVTLLYAFRRYRLSYAKNIMWAFTVFFAITIAVGKESSGADIVVYMSDVKHIYSEGIELKDFYSYFKSTNEIDILRTFLAVLVAQFTDNGYLLLPFYGFLFGYFFSRNMWFVFNRLKGNLKNVTVLLLFCLFLITPIWNLNGFRFWTATHVFIYGLLPYLYSGKKASLFWCLSTPWIFHFAFILPVLVLIGFLFSQVFLKRKLLLYFSFFVITIILNQVDIQQFNQYIEMYAPADFAERSYGYRSENKVELQRELGLFSSGKNWYAILYEKALHWSLTGFLLILYFKSKALISQDKNLIRVLSFTYLFFGVANVMSSIPSGGRYLAPASILAVSILVIYIQNRSQERLMQRAIKIALPLLVLFIIVSFRQGVYFISVTTILGNPLIAIFTIGNNISLNSIIK
jgi:hypothetical protein